MTSTYDLSWNRTSFLSKLKLFFRSRKDAKEKLRKEYRFARAEGYSDLSSVYYSIAGTAFCQLKAIFWPTWLILLAPIRLPLWYLTWLPLGAWCYWRMLPLSDRLIELIGYNGATPEQCDVRQSILRRRGKYDEAKRCIQAAFAMKTDSVHTIGHLHTGLASIYLREDNHQGVEIEVSAALDAADIVMDYDIRQAARIYRNCADILSGLGGDNEADNIFLSDQLREKAKALCESVDARDQALKLWRRSV